jgi:hypothetical protein
MEHIGILVALSPAIIIAMFAIVFVALPAFLESDFMNDIEEVAWLKELVQHAAFYGSVVGTFMGLDKASHETTYLAAVWFVSLLLLSRGLAKRVKELVEKEVRSTHRKNAGMTRSVVRGELQKAISTQPKQWSDTP